MRKIVHLSDIHFNVVDHRLIDPLLRSIDEIGPDLVAVSGDLTQRARSVEFRAAKAFLDRLPQPSIVVPGNHDVPLYNIFRRFIDPLAKYRRYITDDLRPTYFDDEIAVLGINTARSLTIKSGRINEEQIAWARKNLCDKDNTITKIIVTHHPFDLPEGHEGSDIVGRAALAIETLAGCGADLFLAGHMHMAHTGHTAERYKTPNHSALVVQAGSAISTRHRGEPNSFNSINVNGTSISVERHIWQPDAGNFIASTPENFRRDGEKWIPVG